MRLAVISPHLDDAAFSLAEHLSKKPGATIITPFAAVPDDAQGRAKYVRLHAEHKKACEALQAQAVNGPFLDDVYHDTRNLTSLESWLTRCLRRIDQAWIPHGIHHPDHVITAHAALNVVKRLGVQYLVYEELPYRVLYPEQAKVEGVLLGAPQALAFKREVCRMYVSQMGDDLERCLYAHERLWSA